MKKGRVWGEGEMARAEKSKEPTGSLGTRDISVQTQDKWMQRVIIIRGSTKHHHHRHQNNNTN